MDKYDIIKILRLHDRWSGMRQRCSSARAHDKSRYNMCSSWEGMDGRDAFVFWSVENGYEVGLVLDRINNSSGYSPENCQWVTAGENVAKEHRNKEYKGENFTFVELAEHADAAEGLSKYLLKARVASGLTIEEALTKPVGSYVKRTSKPMYKGVAYTYADLAEHADAGPGVKGYTIQRRIVKGWSVEDALKTGIT